VFHDIAILTVTAPYGSKDIRLFLENEQSLLENDQCNDSHPSITLTTRAKPNKLPNVPTCGNPVCKKTGHTMEYCIKPGGGIAGRTIDKSKAAQKLVLKKKTLSSAAPKILIMVKDVNGCAFMVMVDSEPPLSTTAHPEFAGLAYDPISTSDIDEVEYKGVGWY
jgi:hypothetical protein